MKRYPVPLSEIRREMTVSNSRFIACLTPVFSVEEAKSFITRIRKEFSDATHNVPAYLIGFGDAVIAHCSDAGEPSGTAGRPALAVLKGSGMGDVGVVVTRYFGGTKLGTGGLVRAYGDAVRLVTDAVPRAQKVTTHIILAVFPYHFLDRIRLLVAANQGQVLETTYTSDVSLRARLLIDQFPSFQSALSELTNGSVQAEILQTQDYLMSI